jgi:tetratricopeptide (TPR) repeat protein
LLGPENIYVTYPMNNLGTTLLAKGKLEEAEKVHREALALKLKLLGEEHTLIAATLNNLASVLRKEGNLSAAEATNRHALAMRIKLLGEEHADTAVSLENLATVLSDQNNYAEAEPLVRKCLTIREKTIPNDWPTFKARSVLGRSMLGQKKYAEAEPLLLSAYAGLKERESTIPFQNKDSFKETAQCLVQLYTATGQSNQAAAWSEKVPQ